VRFFSGLWISLLPGNREKDGRVGGDPSRARNRKKLRAVSWLINRRVIFSSYTDREGWEGKNGCFVVICVE